MRLAIISDIHGNLEALNQSIKIAHIHSDKVICLGDVVGYGANPNECIDLVREFCFFTLKGNHDQAASDPRDHQSFNRVAREAINWTRNQLTPENKKWLKNLPYQKDYESIHFVHSSLHNPKEFNYITDEYFARNNFEYQKYDYSFCGHTHYPVIFRESKENAEISMMEAQSFDNSDLNCKYSVNVGSIGQPRNGQSRSNFVIFDTENRNLTYHFVPYNITIAQKKILKAGLPEYLAERLEKGR